MQHAERLPPELFNRETHRISVLKEITNDLQKEFRTRRTHAEIVADAICDASMNSLTQRHAAHIAQRVHSVLAQQFGSAGSFGIPCPVRLELKYQLQSLYSIVFNKFISFVYGIMEAKSLCRSDVPVILVSKIVQSFKTASGIPFDHRPVPRLSLAAIAPPRRNHKRVLANLIMHDALSYSNRLVTERMRDVQHRSAADVLALCVFTWFAVHKKGLDSAIIRDNLCSFLLILR